MSSDLFSKKTLRMGGIAWHVTQDHMDALQAWFPRHFLKAWREESRVLKRDHGRRVVAAGGFVLKESTVRRQRSVARFALRRSGSRRAFELAHRLLAAGIPTPRPAAWATVRTWGFRVADYLITEEIPGAQSLAEAMAAHAGEAETREEICRQWGGLLARFHRHGFSNRDMKDSNILIREGRPRCYWVVDLDGVRRTWRISQQRALRDLWPLVRSLHQHGWTRLSDWEMLLRGYNEDMPPGRQLPGLPERGVGSPGVCRPAPGTD